jgi:nucleoprotein TPR
LKKSNEDLQTERDQFAEQVTTMSEEITTLKTQAQTDGTSQEAAIVEAVREAKKKQHESFQTQHREKMAAKNSVIDSITAERDAVQGHLATVQQELDEARQQLASAQASANQSQEQVAALQQEVEQLQSQLGAGQQELAAANAAHDETSSSDPAGNTDVNMGEEGQIDEGESQDSSNQIATLEKSLDEIKKQLADAQNRAFRAENDYSSLKVKESFMRDQVVKLEKDDVSSDFNWPCNGLLTNA